MNCNNYLHKKTSLNGCLFSVKNSVFIIFLMLNISMMIITTQSNYISITITPSITQINTKTSYTFQFVRNINPLTYAFNNVTAVPSNSVLQIIFPNNYVTIASSSGNSNVSCTNANTGVALLCQVFQSNRTINILNYYNTSSTLSDITPTIIVTSIYNPLKSGSTSNFQYYILGPTFSLIDQSPSASNNVYSTALTFTPGTFQSYSISANSATILTSSKLYFNLSPSNSIPSTGQLVIQIPLYWSNDISNTQTLSTAPNCAGVTNISGSISCTSNITTSPLNIVTITISGLTTNSLSSPFQISVQSILTPPYIDSSQTISIYSQWPDGSQIDTCQTNIVNLSPASFQSISFSSLSNTIVQSSFNGSLSLTISKPFYYQDTIKLTVPQNFMNTTITSSNFASFSTTKDSSSLTITLSNFPSSPSILPTNNVITLTLQNLTNPTSIESVTIIASFYRSGSLYQQSSATYSASIGSVNSFSLASDNGFVQAIGNVLLQINTSLLIPSSSNIIISYPSSITATNIASTGVITASLNGVSVSNVNFTVSSNSITIKNLFQSNFTSGLISVYFSSFINPPTVQPSLYNLVIQTFDLYSIMTSTTTITVSLISLISNVISSSSYVVDDISTYSVIIQTNYPFTAVSIILPSDVSVQNGYKATCLPNTFTSCDIIGNNMTFTGTLTSGTYNLSWGYNMNPNSFAITGGFSIYTYYRGWGVQKSQGFLSLQMNQTASFTSATFIPSSYTNNDIISVASSISLPINSPSGAITITFPLSLDISSASCSGIPCTVISSSIQLSFDNSMSTPYQLNFTVNNVKNAPSFQPLGNFILYLNSTAGKKSLQSSKSGWTNNNASTFNTVVSTGDAYLGESSLFTFALTSLSAKQSYVQIQVNDLFGDLTTAPSGATLLGIHLVSFSIPNQATSTLYMTLINPTVFGNYTFSLSTYFTSSNETSYLVGRSVSNIWKQSCFQTVCRQCNPSNNSICIDCYNSTISNYYIFDSAAQTCIRDCLSGYYLVNLVCSPCSNNCLQCFNSSTNCTSCNSSLNLYLDTNYMVCVSVCQDKYYQNTLNQKCSPCVSPCLYCDSSVVCKKCIANYYLLGTDCLLSCPINYYVNNTVNGTCNACNSNCLTCLTITTNCTSCNNSVPLYLQNNKCVNQCQANSFLKNNICTPCQVPCKLCYNSTTTCSTCFVGSSLPIWYNYACVSTSSCPIGFFINYSNSSCNICPGQCEQCTSLTSCQSCSVNFTLYNNTCISSCPNTTYQNNRICLTCTGCLTCDTDFNNCTSCVDTKFLYLGVCYLTCPNGTYSNSALKICVPCTTDCPTCKNSTFCYTCVSNSYLYLGTCNSTCPISTFQTTSLSTALIPNQLICSQCPTTCLTCTSLTYCQSCKINYSLQNDTMCVLTCSQGVSLNQICLPCGLNCAMCNTSGSTPICQLCSTNYYLYNNTCFAICPSNTLSLDSITCVSCINKFSLNCSTCNFTQCLSCTDGQLISGDCYPCTDGTYSKNSKCATCPTVCSICVNSTYCTSCAANYYLYKNFCLGTCPLNMVPSGTQCVICLQHCTVCNLTNSLCSICNSGFYLFEYGCLNSCPTDYVVNLDGTKCVTPEQYYQQYSKAAKIIPFPFSIGVLVLIIIGTILKCYNKFMHLATFLCSVVSLIQISSWIIFIYIQYAAFINNHPEGMKGVACGLAGILMMIILAIVHIKFYLKYIREDVIFQKWDTRNFWVDRLCLTMASIFNFKFYRLVHSRLLEKDGFSMKLSASNKLIPFSLLSGLSILCCSAPLLVGNSFALFFSIAQDQQFFVALDTIIVNILMIILILLDLYHPPTYFFIEIQSENINKHRYQEDDFKVSINGQIQNNPLDQKNMSKGQLLQGYDEVKGGQLGLQSGMKFRGQDTSDKTFYKTKNKNRISSIKKQKSLKQSGQSNSAKKQKTSKQGNQKQEKINSSENIQQINLDGDEFILFQEQGDQGVQNVPKTKKQYIYKSKQITKSEQNIQQEQNSQAELISQSSEKQILQNVAMKWVPKTYDHHGYLLRKNSRGQFQKYDEKGNRVQIDQNGVHHKYNSEGFQLVQINGTQYAKDKNGFFWKDGKKYDQREYQVKENQQTGQIQYYDENGFKVVVQDGKQIKYDQHGFRVQIVDGKIKRYSPQGYQAIIDKNGRIKYFDSDGNHVRKNSNGQWQIYDPEDNFTLIKNQEGQFQKFDKNGYKIKKDKWGNITRYDKDGYRVVLGPDSVSRYNQDNYRVEKDEQGNIALYDQDGYRVEIDENGNKRFYDQNGYEVVRDFYGDITLYDKDGNTVIIDPQTGIHRKYTPQGLQVCKDENGEIYLKDKRGNKVVELQDGYYEKYDPQGNKIWLDQDGYEVEYDSDKNMIRYDKVGDVVQLSDISEGDQQNGSNVKIKKLRKFKRPQLLDFQSQYAKMIQNQGKNKNQQSDQQEPNWRQFHDPEIKETKDYDQELNAMKINEMNKEEVNQNAIQLEMLKSIDHSPQKNIRQLKKKDRESRLEGRYQNQKSLSNDELQDEIELKSIADASVDERSFINEGVQPIQTMQDDSDELQSVNQMGANMLNIKSKRKNKGMHSELEFDKINQNGDTKTQYNYQKVNVQVKKKIYDQNDDVESLHQENWQQQQGVNTANLFYRAKDFSNANTNINEDNLIYMEDQQSNQNDILSDFIPQNSKDSDKNSNSRYKHRYQSKQPSHSYKKSNMQSIQQMQNELFDKFQHQQDGIKQRTGFKLSGGPNPLVQYAKTLQARKSLQQKMYLQDYYQKKDNQGKDYNRNNRKDKR